MSATLSTHLAGESMTLRYRVYVHGGGPEDGKVEQVYAGFTNAKTE